MKKLSLCYVCIFIFMYSDAQQSFGLKGGLNISSWTGSGAEGAQSHIGAYIGGLVTIPVSSLVNVQPELVYSMEGVKANDGNGNRASVNMGYMNIPVLFQFKTKTGFFFETGPQLGLLLNANVKIQNVSVGVKESFKSTNFSWAFGMGYKLETGLGFGARYNLGITSIANSDDPADNVRTSVIAIGLTYNFPTVKKRR